MPGAFNACLIPEEKSEQPKKKGLKATFSRNFARVRLLFPCHWSLISVFVYSYNNEKEV